MNKPNVSTEISNTAVKVVKTVAEIPECYRLKVRKNYKTVTEL